MCNRSWSLSNLSLNMICGDLITYRVPSWIRKICVTLCIGSYHYLAWFTSFGFKANVIGHVLLSILNFYLFIYCVFLSCCSFLVSLCHPCFLSFSHQKKIINLCHWVLPLSFLFPFIFNQSFFSLLSWNIIKKEKKRQKKKNRKLPKKKSSNKKKKRKWKKQKKKVRYSFEISSIDHKLCPFFMLRFGYFPWLDSSIILKLSY